MRKCPAGRMHFGDGVSLRWARARLTSRGPNAAVDVLRMAAVRVAT